MNSEFIDRMKKVASHLSEAQQLLSKGPLDYYFAKLVEHSEALMTMAPFQVGDKVKIAKEVPCSGGWVYVARSLEVGATGEITAIDYKDGSFVFDFAPDRIYYHYRDDEKQQWKEYIPSSESRKSFELKAMYLEKT